MTTRGLKEKEFVEIGKIIAASLKNSENSDLQDELRMKVLDITNKFPMINLI